MRAVCDDEGRKKQKKQKRTSRSQWHFGKLSLRCNSWITPQPARLVEPQPIGRCRCRIWRGNGEALAAAHYSTCENAAGIWHPGLQVTPLEGRAEGDPCLVATGVISEH